MVVTRWEARFLGRRFPCAVGFGGVGRKRGEGDGITPLGVHRLESVLWRADRRVRPAGPLPVQPIGPAQGWSDDPADPLYNRRVPWPHCHSAERLRRADRLYDLVAITDFNRRPPVAGAGSAIFLHVWKRPRKWTAGCVAFRAQDLAWILARWTPRSRLIVR
ncbi:L,D-transpeptidase family protein [Albimonas sp. CAU 1670]|uniref:L,D-transpeptidase family protein n=1 Tax=Albimonas sp. CAU 1670 TaxID=3032599 RepID=UPI0023DB8AF5|nr:L,D-transpeptidase family protein [Albimonas sp. CAU 1670]MDF2231176.1 L,D-transpeptidase family protein [Albimonas sp. CAU 1670]